jgi:hypothetical protein
MDHVYRTVSGVAFYIFVCCCLYVVVRERGAQSVHSVYYDKGVKYAYVFEIYLDCLCVLCRTIGVHIFLIF